MEKSVKLPVRQLVEFVLRGGSIDNRFGGADRALEGSRIHRLLQKKETGNYRAEVRFSFTAEYEGTSFTAEGRADGIRTEDSGVTVDEIKTTAVPLELIDENFNPLHWAQANCYAYFYACEQKLDEIKVRLVYYHIETEEIKRFIRSYPLEELEKFYFDLLKRYKVWADWQSDWNLLRDRSIEPLAFPFTSYREGQRKLAVSVYKAIQREGRLFCQAPTGIGKTISTIYPSVKAMGKGLCEKIFYLTAKTITRKSAEEAFDFLRKQPLRLKTVTLTAKDKICFLEERRCNPVDCPYADGHFDRVNNALYELITHYDAFPREIIEEAAKTHMVCPFELSLDLSLWCDCIICDYNYLFDPSASLKRYFSEGKGEYVFLVDEAHNLVDRSREMYSARLQKSALSSVKRKLSKSADDKKLKAALQKAITVLQEFKDSCGEELVHVQRGLIEELGGALIPIVTKCEEWLQGHMDSAAHAEVLDLYFGILNYQRVSEVFDDHYVTLADLNGRDAVIILYCIDPSAQLDQMMNRGRAAILFSATLSPISYYASVLGGKEGENRWKCCLDSPFPPENLGLYVARQIRTKYKEREESYDELAELILETVKAKTGNYLVFFPSYSYCKEVFGRFSELCGEDCTPVMQQSGMTEEEREAFLALFSENPAKSMAAFCVLGGIFSEGIDLRGERLIGTVIVGVGLPQIGPEQDVIRDYYDDINHMGFAYAYRYPGMNKVLQAAGRVIRGSSDRGIVILADERFSSRAYRELFPAHWSHFRQIADSDGLKEQLDAFWNRVEG